MREVPVSFESLLENNGDPSHVFFAHHGVLARREDSVPISLQLTPEGREQGVFTFKVGPSPARRPGGAAHHGAAHARAAGSRRLAAACFM
jgi:phenylpropionate dioxygenase-like ring-hydroxylating dioxygenase large terminal subunit